ncbi:histidine kinase [Hymenobacter sp. 15J16-1T3B]|uniref:sensor histidine kinase n=1 Tax=Hymenobacter sp. 15J16-1T3B TaxID=2886941 RepID=UPI001D0FE2A0|nr:histidine kinase [Hymenobacter sp. 15J16-1T3B]MCC3160122.1 histidine kinase [Hymenobacter sp. 15J16-1T3B]
MLSLPALTRPFTALGPDDAHPSAPRTIARDVLLGFALWFMLLLFLVSTDAPNEPRVYGCTLLAVAVLFHAVACRWLIPSSWGKRRPFGSYWLKAFLVLVASVVPVALVLLIITSDSEVAIGFNVFQVFFNLLVTAPLSWLLYRRRWQRQSALTGLQQELGHSEASLDLLRSQINPHFLFNALNTLYGTALQEHGERTAHGIQLLGDMMRFMLHENHQAHIALTREIDYLRNYVELQTLRTATSPDISISTSLADAPAAAQIAPMLLIPFVENAFKHGISLQHKSWIKVTLHVEQGTLYFDVYNSLHARPAPAGPAAEASGIGLSNVRQRLQLLYPERHELIIRRSLDEYFVHLTLQL